MTASQCPPCACGTRLRRSESSRLGACLALQPLCVVWESMPKKINPHNSHPDRLRGLHRRLDARRSPRATAAERSRTPSTTNPQHIRRNQMTDITTADSGDFA